MAEIDKAAQIRAKEKARIRRELEQIRLRLAANVRAAREAKGWTQQYLSDLSGLHLTAVSKIERATSLPGIDTLVKLADSLGLTLEELRDGIIWQNPPGRFAVEPRPAADHRRTNPPATV